MNSVVLMRLKSVKKTHVFSLLLLLVVAWYHGQLIGTRPFPMNLAFALVLPLFLFCFLNIRWAILLWFVATGLSKEFMIDLPGIPPLGISQILLLLLLGVWFLRSYEELRPAVSRFLSSPKNRILLSLFGWVTLSMVIAQIGETYQSGFKYQSFGLFTVLLTILAVFFVSEQTDRRLLNWIIWFAVVGESALIVATLTDGVMRGVELYGWKIFAASDSPFKDMGFGLSLALVLALFPIQRGWKKAVFGVALILGLNMKVLMALSGSRTDFLSLVGLFGFFILFTRPTITLSVGFFIVFPIVLVVAAMHLPVIESWVSEEASYTFHRGAVFGKGTRVVLAEDAMRMIKERPLWGNGSDQFRLYTDVVMPYKHFRRPAASLHNTWLQIAVDNGIPAAILLGLFFWRVFKEVFLLYRSLQHGLYRKFTLAFLVSFCTTIIQSPFGGFIWPYITGSDFGVSQVQVFANVVVQFWIYYGMVVGIEHRAKRIGGVGAEGIE